MGPASNSCLSSWWGWGEASDKDRRLPSGQTSRKIIMFVCRRPMEDFSQDRADVSRITYKKSNLEFLYLAGTVPWKYHLS